MADWFEPVSPPAEEEASRPLGARLGWFVLIALAGVLAVAGAAYLLRALLFIN